MSDQPSGSELNTNESPVRKNPRGKFVSSGKKEIIINIYKTKKNEFPNMKYKDLIKIVSETSGVGKNTVGSTISEYKKTGLLKSPNKKKNRPSVIQKIDDFEKNAIRRKIHDFWLKREIPTLNKILIAVNTDQDLPDLSLTSLYRLMKEMNFVYKKRKRNSALLESDHIVSWRNQYIENIRKYREDGRPVYYLDETWVNTGECLNKTCVDNTVTSCRDAFLKGLSTGAANPNGKSKRLIVVHIGSDEGFVPGGLLFFESKKNTSDYHDEMNGVTFFNWMKGVIPLLKPNSVIVMDNASYHSVKIETCPTSAWPKKNIKKWLDGKSVVYNKQMLKIRLLELVKKIKPQFNKYVVDEYVKDKNMEILRLPPYHCELNPIELVWSSIKNFVKANNTTFKLPDVQQLFRDGVDRVTPEMWKQFVEHTKKEEDKFWTIDFHVESVLEDMDSTMMTITGDTTSGSDDNDF